MSTGPTWADVANRNRTTERRDVVIGSEVYECPFCGMNGRRSALAKSTGHRCGCGALFYTHQAVAVHFKERE